MNKPHFSIAMLLGFLCLVIASKAGTAADTKSLDATQYTGDPAERPVIGMQYDGPIKVVYQVTEDEWKEGVSKPLLYLLNLRAYYQKQGVAADQLDIRAVVHGEASTHVLTDAAYNRVKNVDTGNPNTQLLTELSSMGVQIELCDSRRQKEGWSKADIHPRVLLAAAAYARLIDLQHQGYAYIKF